MSKWDFQTNLVAIVTKIGMLTGRDATVPYQRLKWKGKGFEDFNVYVHTMTGDGSCLIHCICYALYVPYHRRVLNGERVTRREIVRRYRDELANKLATFNPVTGFTYYESVEEGRLAASSESVPEYSLESIQELLRSNDSLGATVISVIESVIGVSIYVIDSRTEDVYYLASLPLPRWSIVLYYDGGHFNAVSVVSNSTQIHSTSFEANNPFVAFLRKRLSKRLS